MSSVDRSRWLSPVLVAALAMIHLAFTTDLYAQHSKSAKDPFDDTVRLKDYLEPAIPRPDQEKIAKSKLAALREKSGRPPNILIFLVDDMS